MSEEQRKEWEYFQYKAIPAYIDRLNNLEEQKSDIDVKKKDIIQEMAERAEKFMIADEVCRFLKVKLKGIVGERTVEEALGQKHKRKYERYQEESKPLTAVYDDNKTIEVSTSGSQSITNPDGNDKEQEIEEGTGGATADDIQTTNVVYGSRTHFQDTDRRDEIAERSAEIALSAKKDINDLNIRLNEAFRLIEDKDSVIQKLRVELGNREIEVGELRRNKPPVITNRVVDETKEDLQIQLDEAKQTIIELRQVEAIRTRNQDFNVASKVASPSKVWIAAINASGLTRALVQITMKAADSNLERRKVLFDVTDEGQLKNPRLEGS